MKEKDGDGNGDDDYITQQKSVTNSIKLSSYSFAY